MTEQSGDFLDSGVYGEPAAAGESELPAAGPPYGVPVSAGTGWKAALRPTAWLAAGVVAGAVAVAAWHSSSTASPANPAAAQGQLPNGAPGFGGQAPNGQPGLGGPGTGGQGDDGQGFGGQGFGGQGFGGRADEQRVSGTVTAVGASSVTVRLANGTSATYAVIATSDIVKDGARVSLSAIKAGDAVFLHVYPSNGRTVVEHLFAGQFPDRRPNPGDQTSSGTTKT